jgi:hypothetical protein
MRSSSRSLPRRTGRFYLSCRKRIRQIAREALLKLGCLDGEPLFAYHQEL